MSDEVSIDAAELLRLAVDLEGWPRRVGQRSSQVLRKTAHAIEATAKALAPVDTGNLRSSISTDITGDGSRTEMAAEIGPTAAYGAYVEFGTSRAAPQAYMGPALDRHEPLFIAAMELLADEGLR